MGCKQSSLEEKGGGVQTEEPSQPSSAAVAAAEDAAADDAPAVATAPAPDTPEDAAAVAEANAELIKQAEKRNEDRVKELLKAGPAKIEAIEATGSVDSTVLPEIHDFTNERDHKTTCLQVLLKAGAPVDQVHLGKNGKPTSGTTALMGAARKGIAANVQLLLEAKANVQARNNQGHTVLQQAMASEREVIKLLLEAGAVVENLRMAAKSGSKDKVQEWIQKGANIEQSGNAGELGNPLTPLMFTAKYGHTECVQVLLQAGAKVDATVQDGMTPLMWAAQGNHTDCVKELLQGGANVETTGTWQGFGGWTALMVAAEAGCVECVQELLLAGADVNAVAPGGKTPLIVATMSRRPKVVEELLRCEPKPNVNAQDAKGKTALALAEQFRCEPIAKLLREA